MKTFSYPSNVDVNNRVVVYDIKDLGKQLKPLGMMVVLENLWDKIVRNRERGIRTRIYIDEIYLLFRNEESANFLFELYKRARKMGRHSDRNYTERRGFVEIRYGALHAFKFGVYPHAQSGGERP